MIFANILKYFRYNYTYTDIFIFTTYEHTIIGHIFEHICTYSQWLKKNLYVNGHFLQYFDIYDPNINLYVMFAYITIYCYMKVELGTKRVCFFIHKII